MSAVSSRVDLPLGRYLAVVREGANLTQAQLANRLTYSPASISRIESGDKSVTGEELDAFLMAVGTAQARQLGEYVGQAWDELERPGFEHPNRDSLWVANLALRKLRQLRSNPNVINLFVQQIDLYERELLRLASYLQSCEHRVAFIGSIGDGKSTAICKMAGLLKAGESKLDKEIVLETGGGGITLCEVHVARGPQYGLSIVPRTEDSIRKDVEELAEYLIRATRTDALTEALGAEDADGLGISREVVRAIRNMSGLVEKRREEGGKRVRVDPARELASQYPKTGELTIQILARMDLLRRHRREAWFPNDGTASPMQWLQQIFSDVNNGRHPEFSLPQKIEVIVPDPVFASQELPITVIDTKGVDQTAERQDLACHFDDPRTLVVLCSRFFDAPGLSTQTLLQRAREINARDIGAKTVVLVLPRPDEALAVKDNGGSEVESDQEGYELKKEQIDLRLSQLGLDDLPVLFFNAKQDDAEPVRDFLVSRITRYRNLYCDAIGRLSEAVDELVANQEDVKIGLVFKQVGRRLSTWIEGNRELDWDDIEVHRPLVAAIGTTRFASTIRASVNRNGDWHNLDYYHHLSHGTRRLAVERIGKKIEEFKITVRNAYDDEELEPARTFLDRVVDGLDNAVDEAYKKIQVVGREAFRTELTQDLALWQECRARWGGGPGYREAIRDKTDRRFTSSYEDARQIVRHLVLDEWSRIIGLLEGMLQEREGQAPKTLDAKLAV